MHSAAFLFPVLLVFPLAHPSATAQTDATPLTVERIYAHGPLIGTLPEGITWSPDGKHLTYLDGGELVDMDPGTGKPHVLVSRAKLASISGASGTEQDRDHRQRYKMASYMWSPDSKHLLFDANGRLWLYDLGNGTGLQVGFTDTASGDDPKFSPNGEIISFVRNHGLSVVHPRELVDAAPFQVAPAPPVAYAMNGQVDWVYEEELGVRSNHFWSPDSKNIAFLQMIEGNVPQYPIEDWLPVHASVEMQRYPQPGDDNPEVRVGVVGTAGGKINFIKLPCIRDKIMFPGSDGLTGTRCGSRLFLAATSSATSTLPIFPQANHGSSPKSPTKNSSIENYDVFVDGGNLVLSDWKDGHNQIYLYSYNPGSPMLAATSDPKQLTSGDFDVDGISFLDSAHHTVFYASNEGNVLEQQLWQVDFDGKRKPVTTDAGFHEGNFSPNGEMFVDRFSTRMDPPRLSICKTGGECKAFWSTRALEPFQCTLPSSLIRRPRTVPPCMHRCCCLRERPTQRACQSS